MNAVNDAAWKVGFKWTHGDVSNPTGAIAVDTTSKALHIADIADITTDWNVAVATHPTVYVHSATTPATDYASFDHDATDFTLNVASGNLKIAFDGTDAFTLTSADLIMGAGLGIIRGSTTQTTTSTWDGAAELIPEVQFIGVNSVADGAVLIAQYSTANTAAVSPHLVLLKGGANTQVSTTALADNEVVGVIGWAGTDGTDAKTYVAAIYGVVDDSGGPGTGAIGGSLEFYTTADGGETLTLALTISNTQALLIGASGSAVSFTQGSPQLAVYLTNGSTNGSNSVNSLYWETTMTGAAGVGGRALFYMTTNVALGGWSNALKAEVVYGASGRTTGLGSAFVAELTLSAGTTAGTYAALEAELNAPANAVAGTAVSFLYMNATDTAAVINTANGYLFEIGTGVTDTVGGIFEAEVNTDSMSMTHVLKIRIAGTAYYIPLNTAKTF